MEAVFTLLNATALLGWSAVLASLVLQSMGSSSFIPGVSLSSSPFAADDDSEGAAPPVVRALLFLEAICLVEVGRIALGQLRGNLVLGAVLHAIRATCLILVLPDGLSSSSSSDGADEDSFPSQYALSIVVLYSWSLTEVGRYPMYLFPTSSAARCVRLVLPIVTFPLGAAAEAVGAYRALTGLLLDGGTDGATADAAHWTKVGLLTMVVLVNGLLGPTMAYPALLRKGLPVLMGKADEKAKKKKT